MPVPMYIICSESSLAYPPARQLHVTNVVEVVYFAPSNSESGADEQPVPDFHVNAAWARSKEDSNEQEFVFRFTIELSSNGPVFEMAQGSFSFGKNPLHRITLVGKLWGVGGGPGICRVIGRLWPKGNESAGIEQVYTFVVLGMPDVGIPKSESTSTPRADGSGDVGENASK
jgi:hypothetical protein